MNCSDLQKGGHWRRFLRRQHPFGPQHDDQRLRAIALHGRSISISDPSNKELVTITAPVSDEWAALELPSDRTEPPIFSAASAGCTDLQPRPKALPFPNV